jgi:choline dehydrogenase
MLCGIVVPQSRGNVTIVSADTSNLHLIIPNWLTDPVDQSVDQSVALAIYKRARQAFATPAMCASLADLTEYFPGQAVKTDVQILNTVRDTLHTI